MELTPELIRKHKDRLLEATTNVRAQTRHSKKGKIFNVKQHDRKLSGVEKRVLDDLGLYRGLDSGTYITPKEKKVLKSFMHKGWAAPLRRGQRQYATSKSSMVILTPLGRKIMKSHNLGK